VTVNISNSQYQPESGAVKVGTQINLVEQGQHRPYRDAGGMFDNFVNAMSAHGAPVTMTRPAPSRITARSTRT